MLFGYLIDDCCSGLIGDFVPKWQENKAGNYKELTTKSIMYSTKAPLLKKIRVH